MIKERLTQNWDMWRIIRMLLALTFLVSGIVRHDTLLGITGGFLVLHTLLNACAACVGGSCDVPLRSQQQTPQDHEKFQ